MLKIERADGKGQILLEFKKKSAFFNRTLLTALAWAFAVHLSGALLFHIGPFELINSGFLPPAVVEIDLENAFLEPDISATAKIERERKLSRFPFAPKTVALKIPPMPAISDAHDVVEKNRKNCSLKVKFRGALAGKNIEMGDFSSLEPFEGVHVIYDVKVDNKTGRIFWMEPKGFLTLQQNEAIKNFLKSIQVEKGQRGWITKGEVEVQIPSKGDF